MTWGSVRRVLRQEGYWLPPEAYKDFATLCQSVADVLAQVGAKYSITFA